MEVILDIDQHFERKKKTQKKPTQLYCPSKLGVKWFSGKSLFSVF